MQPAASFWGVAVTAGDDEVLAEAMAEALRQRELPAFVGIGNANSMFLDGQVEHGVLTWRLFDRDGTELGRHSQPASLPETLLAAQAADILAPLALPSPSRLRVSLQIVEAPGDGTASLHRAIQAALAASAGAEIVSPDAPADYRVEGRVRLSDGPPGQDLVDVAWTLQDAEGRELGVARQAAPVPRGMLSGPWGRVARDIAAGGAEGIAEILAQTRPSE